jgi:hypothetical protein
MSAGRIIGWLLVPYVMVFVDWKRAHVLLKIYGVFAAFFMFLSVIVAATMDDTQTTTKPKPTATVKKEPAKPKVLTEEEKAKKRKDEYLKCFSSWDGSHTNLKYYIEDNMDDPNSFEHVKTIYYDYPYPNHLIVEMTFRGNNQFGALVKNTVKAQTSADSKCTVMKIIDQW